MENSTSSLDKILQFLTTKAPGLMMVLAVSGFIWLTTRTSDLSLNDVRIDGDVQRLKEDMKEVRSDIKGMKEDISELKTDVAILKTDVAAIKSDVAEIKADLATIKAILMDPKRRP